MLYFFSPRLPRGIPGGPLYTKPHHPVGPGKTLAVEFLGDFCSITYGADLIHNTVFNVGFRLVSDWVSIGFPIGFRLGS